MARGTGALIGGLGALALMLLLLVVGALWLLGAAPQDAGGHSLWGMTWLTFMRMIDTGAISGDSGTALYVALMFLATLGGIFLMSTLIGVLNSGIEARLATLRRGRSRVLEQNHTVILGWSPMVHAIISELVIANANRPRACIAILADRDKVEMEEEIREKIPDTRGTRIVCRSGDAIDLDDLEIVNPREARAIVILAPDSGNPDAQVIKMILALTNNPRRKEGKYHIVAEIHDERNLEVAALVGRDEVELVLADDLISKITAQTCRQSGLSVVYNELLDFDGCEIYTRACPEHAGRSYAEVVMAYDTSAVIGILRAGRDVYVNPPADTPFAADDHVIAITEDDDTLVRAAAPPLVDEAAMVWSVAEVPLRETTLMLGWNRRGPRILRELDRYVGMGSEMVVVSSLAGTEDELEQTIETLKNTTTRFIHADTTLRATLDTLDCARFDHIILLSYAEAYPAQEADARTLMTLLHLRDIADRSGRSFSIVSEMLDSRNRALADVTRADDFIVSNLIDSRLLAQIAENKHLASVFREIFDADGSEIYIKPAEQYISPGTAVTFATVVASALRRGETAIGYRLRAHASDPSRAYGVLINPAKSHPITLNAGDRVIVLAEN